MLLAGEKSRLIFARLISTEFIPETTFVLKLLPRVLHKRSQSDTTFLLRRKTPANQYRGKSIPSDLVRSRQVCWSFRVLDEDICFPCDIPLGKCDVFWKAIFEFCARDLIIKSFKLDHVKAETDHEGFFWNNFGCWGPASMYQGVPRWSSNFFWSIQKQKSVLLMFGKRSILVYNSAPNHRNALGYLAMISSLVELSATIMQGLLGSINVKYL